MNNISNTNKIKSLLLSFILSGILWLILSLTVMEMTFGQYFIIEWSVALSHFFSIFVKEKMGIIPKKPQQI